MTLAQANQVFESLQARAPNQRRQSAYGAKLLRADRVQRISTGQGVTVAVIDTGADTEHPDLQGRIAQTVTFVEKGEPSFRTDRHGTAVAGVIGARPGRNGMIGMAPDAQLTVLKACWYSDPTGDKAQCSSWALAKAVDHAINHQFRVVNLGLGGQTDDLLTRLLAAAEKNRIVVVAAASNNTNDPGFPASLDSVIPAIACNAKGQAATPHWPHALFAAAAPGVEVIVPTPGDGYTPMSGSSLAAAHITGVVALLLQQNPQATPGQIRTILKTSARPLAGANSNNPLRVGLIDACAALAQQAPDLACR